MSQESENTDAIAIIGMACRFPQSNTPNDFWSHLCNSNELIQKVGSDNRSTNYIASKAYLENLEYFDADLFSLTPREAKFLDPQQRVLLECAWECFEDASYFPSTNHSNTGVFVGANTSHYFLNHLLPLIKENKLKGQDEMLILVNNGSDYLASKISYLFGLTGPSISLQSACSTSLLTVYQACQSLLSYQCDQALAGGVSITLPNKQGYTYTPDSIYSPDGHCKPFDKLASGTVFGDGGALLLLKRYDDAIESGDQIHAIIKAAASNNDGNNKANFFTPSREGQARVISEAIAFSEVPIESIRYIEAHGTGTQIGDPIEINALKDVFQCHTEKKQFCAIGSVKSNVGHLNAAAGVAGLFKAVYCLKNKKVPPTLHFQEENPLLQLKESPFYIPKKEIYPWNTTSPACAAISSFGIGGSNVHLVLQEAPPVNKNIQSNSAVILPLSANSPGALKELLIGLKTYLLKPSLSLKSLAYSLQVGRKPLPYRKAFVGNCATEFLEQIELFKTIDIDTSIKSSNINSAWLIPKKERPLSFELQLLINKIPFFSNCLKNLNLELFSKLIQIIDPFYLLQLLTSLMFESFGILPDLLVVENSDNPLAKLINAEATMPEELSSLIQNTPSKFEKLQKTPLLVTASESKLKDMSISLTLDVDFYDKLFQNNTELLNLLALFWEKGHSVDFSNLYEAPFPQKIPLFTYPFQRKKFWIEAEEKNQKAPQEDRKIKSVNEISFVDSQKNEIASKLTSIFQSTLEITSVDPKIDFFALGGDSLLALEVIEQIKSTFGQHIELANLFSNFTIEGVTELINSKLELPIH